MIEIIVRLLDDHHQQVLQRIANLKEELMSAISDLQDAQTASEAQVAAVVTEVHTLTDQLANTAPDDTAALADLTTRIKASTAALAALVPTAPPADPNNPARPADPSAPVAAVPTDPTTVTPAA